MLAFFFEGTFMARGKFSSGGNYPPGQFAQGAIIPSGKCRGHHTGGNHPGGNFPRGNFPGGNFPR